MKALHSFLLLGVAVLAGGCTHQTAFQRIAPLPAGVSIDKLDDCIVPAAFTSDNFNWMGDNLRMTVYNEDLYDAVEVSQMKVGDTLVYEGQPMVVRTIKDENGGLTINGGLEEGGCWLTGYEGGTFIPRIWDDHSVYTELGQTQAVLAEDFIVIDCGSEPTDPSDTIRTGQKLYLESLKADRRSFGKFNTRVRFEKGLVKEIKRHWIP